MNETERLDRIDLLILDALQHNSRMTNKELAAAVHLSPTPVYERWKRLEREGYIRKYITVLDAEKLNRSFMVFCCVKLNRLNSEAATDFTERINAMPEVTECYNISGHFDYMLKVQSFNMKQYQQFLLNVLGRIDSVTSIESTFVIEETKHLYGVGVI
ncbi:MAG: Lrp/AsnC family transcriptional regulator [Bacteroidaceae bacterium]|nr:Lrp/AsnC family transcriptional regulator [Bacteroidaceae bacterium]